MKNPTSYDAIIIGSGQAGTPLANLLAEEDWNVALVEKGLLGGTCVNTGCTPTKAYLASARAAWMFEKAKELGISMECAPTIDLQAIKSRKEKLLKQSRKGIRESFESSSKITLIKGEAHFIDKKILKVGSKYITADKIFLNVGARPRIPKDFEKVNYLTNESILQLEKIPEHLIIIGGSYIGLEFAQIFRRFGSKVTILEVNEFLISREDEDTSKMVQTILEKEGIKIICGIKNISPTETKEHAKVAISFSHNSKTQRITGSHLLLAVGRTPNSDLLAPEKTGLKLSEKGYFKVNATLETNVKGIYALGDCNGEGAFTHTAYNDFEIIRDQLFGSKKRSLKDRFTNYNLYIDPPLGRAGISLNEAKKSEKKLLVAHILMSDIARAKEKSETMGKMEVIVDAQSEQIIGATVLGTGGDEVIGAFLTAMYSKASYKTLMNSVQTHPTVTELIPTLLQKLEPLKS